ncbi:MAG TPA: copper chaperone PCu(A)C [Hyphomonadaceae bacterium]|nr:copper chaperone PCu(A)C [Hyphomonadaceae bacterium]
MAALLVLSLAACEQSSGVRIDRAEFRPPLGSSGIGVAYLSLRAAKADRIVAVSSSEADAVEIHESVTHDGQVSMKRVTTLDLPANTDVVFKPNGLHLMVFSPRQIAAETTFPITFQFESGLKETVPFKKIAFGAEPPN